MPKVKIQITNISATSREVFGLGKDGLVYKWNTETGKWELYKNG